MVVVNRALWAKKKNEGQLEWLPLAQHLEDTAGVASLLWEHWIDQSVRDLLTSSMSLTDQDQAKSFFILLAALHDIGKATPAFQAMSKRFGVKDIDEQLFEKMERNGFIGITDFNPSGSPETHHTVTGQYLLQKFGVPENLACIIGAHHGKPLAADFNVYFENSYASDLFQTELTNTESYKKWSDCQRTVYNWGLERSGLESVSTWPCLNQPAQVLLSGLLIVADWIASNEHYFPLISVESDFVSNSERRLEAAWQKWHKTETWEPSSMGSPETLYQHRFGFIPREIQSSLSEIVSSLEDPGIIILEAPMGVGKTEAALAVAEQLAYRCNKSGIYFGLPTQATSNGIFRLYEEIGGK